MKKLLPFLLLLPLVAFAAPTTTFFTNIAPTTANTYSDGTVSLPWLNFYTKYASTTQITVSGQTSGCAQFNAVGFLTSIGVNCGSGSGTVSQINTNFPILGGPITTTGTLTFGGLSTSSAAIIGNIPYFSGVNTFANVATSTLTATSPLTGSFTHVGTTGSLGCQAASGSQAGCLSATDWTTFNGKQAAGNYITALTGDVTAAGPGSVASTLATVNGNVGSFTYGSFTVNGKGLITAASSGATPEVPLTFTWPLVRTTNTVSFNGLSTTSPWTTGQIAYVASNSLITSAATGTVSAGTGISVTAGQSIIGSGLTVTNTGVTSLTATSPLSRDTATGAVTISCPTCSVGGITALGSGYASTTGTTITHSTSTLSFNGLTFGQAITVPNSGTLLFTPTVTGTLNNSGLTNSSITVNSTSIALGASGTITAASSSILGDTNTWTGQDRFSFASTTLGSITNFYSGLTGVLIGNGANSLVTAGSAQTCTNQFFRALSATYSVTCASVGDSDFSGQLAVNHGGTGAATLTGLLQGNGTSAITGVTGTAGQLPYYNGTNTLLATSTLFVSTASNVGIGTSTPWGKLAISTAAQQDGTIPLFNIASTTNTSLFSVLGNGNVGIGTASPITPFNIGGAFSLPNNQDGVIKITAAVTPGTTNGQADILARNTFTITGGNNISGLDIVPTFNSSANITLERGAVLGGFFNPMAGTTLSNADGINWVLVFGSSAAGSITNSHTVYVNSPLQTGSVYPTNQYGIEVQNQGLAGMTNNYGLYVDAQSGATNNYAAIFAGGNVGIGTSTPVSKLTVNGDIGTDGLPPVVSLCGTGAVLTAGSTDTAGEVMEGTLATGCTITFKAAKSFAPFCTASSEAGLAFSFTQSASALTMTNIGALSSTKVDYICVQNNR